MSSFWATDDGWPYADTGPEEVDPTAEDDDDLFSLRATPGHLLDGLDPIEAKVVRARYGLGGEPARSIKELQRDLGLGKSELRGVLGAGLTKVRRNLSG